MAQVTGHSKAHHAKKGRPRRITIEDVDNGFVVGHHRDDGNGGMGPPEKAVFNKHGAMHKHLRALTSEMRSPEPTSGEMTGEEPENQQS